MPPRRAEPRRRRLDRADAGHDFDAQALRALVLLQSLEHGRGHGEDAGVAARHDNHMAALLGERQGVMRPVEFHAVVAGVAHLARPLRHAVEIGLVADQILRARQGFRDLRRHPFEGARPQTHHIHAARTHGRRPSPGTSSSEK